MTQEAEDSLVLEDRMNILGDNWDCWSSRKPLNRAERDISGVAQDIITHNNIHRSSDCYSTRHTELNPYWRRLSSTDCSIFDKIWIWITQLPVCVVGWLSLAACTCSTDATQIRLNMSSFPVFYRQQSGVVADSIHSARHDPTKQFCRVWSDWVNGEHGVSRASFLHAGCPCSGPAESGPRLVTSWNMYVIPMSRSRVGQRVTRPDRLYASIFRSLCALVVCSPHACRQRQTDRPPFDFTFAPQ